MINPKSGIRTFLFGVLGAAAFVVPASADSVTDFYKGRTLTLTMGTRPGGSFQVYGQMFAAHMPKYIPGNPKIRKRRNLPRLVLNPHHNLLAVHGRQAGNTQIYFFTGYIS